MSPILSPELILTGLLLLGTTGLYITGRKLKQEDVTASTFVLFFMYLALVWLPLGWRDGLMGTFIVLIGVATGSFIGGAIFAGVTYAISTLIPGGMSALLLIVIALFVLIWVAESISHLKRISRAKKLEPGKIVEHEVGLGGVIEATQPIESLLPDVPCAAWWFKMGEFTTNSAHPLLLKSKEMLSVIELKDLGLSLGANSRTIEKEDLKKFIETNKIGAPTPKPDDTATIHWIEEGKEAYLIGIPTWETRQESSGFYRELAMTPVFRSTPEKQAYLANKAKDDVYRGAIWDLCLGIGSFLQCAVIVGFQIYFKI